VTPSAVVIFTRPVARTLRTVGIVFILVAALGGCGGGDDQERLPPLVFEQPEQEGDEPGTGDAPPPTFPNTATTNTIRVAGRSSIENAAGVASAVYPAVDERTRPSAVTLVDAEDWQGGVAASVLASGALGAPILLTDGNDIPAVTAGTLSRLDPAGARLADDAQVVTIGEDVPSPDGRKTEVISGKDPYETAAEIDSFHSAVEGEPSDDVVIASGEEPEFAMPAAAWAARSGDSVLFTEPESLPAATRAAIEDHENPDIFVLGPETVISESVLRDLDEVGASVERIAGDEPVANAVEFARYLKGNFGWGLVTPGHNYTLASVANPLDAAAAAPLASHGTFAPLLLTDDEDEVPPALRGYFLDVQPGYEDNPNEGVFNRVWLLGDDSTLSLALQTEVDRLAELVPVDLGGGGGGGGGSGGPDDLPGSGGGLPDNPGGIPAPQGPGLPGSGA
jgi:hypothetical protein